MKLNPDCFRDILIAVEKLPVDNKSLGLDVPGYSVEEIFYHLHMIDDAGYIVMKFIPVSGDPYMFHIDRLTYQGHEFLEASRDNDAWDHVKSIMAKGGSFVLDVAQAILTDYLKKRYLG